MPSFALLKSKINVLSKIREFLIYKSYKGFKVSFFISRNLTFHHKPISTLLNRIFRLQRE